MSSQPPHPVLPAPVIPLGETFPVIGARCSDWRCCPDCGARLNKDTSVTKAYPKGRKRYVCSQHPNEHGPFTFRDECTVCR